MFLKTRFPRLHALFCRYATEHLRLETAGRPIFGRAGAATGWIDCIILAEGRLRVTGWALAPRVTLHLAGSRVSAIPGLRREDIALVTGNPVEVGFELSLPCNWETLCENVPELVFEAGSASPLYSLPLSGIGLIQARINLTLRFLRDGLRALPAALAWRLSHNPRHRARVKRLLGLDRTRLALHQIDGALLASQTEESASATGGLGPVAIIVPVYNAFELLGELLDRLVRHTDRTARLILIEDRSSDPRVRPFLRARATEIALRADGISAIDLLENEVNLGFVESSNRGIAHALKTKAGAVVLLNSDAFVPEGWLSRLIAPLNEPDVASVTPMSNDAEIFSVPALCSPTELLPGQVDAIDAAARALSFEAGKIEAPTGVGFCMAIARPWLERVPSFDTAFGRGYGEEVDWCQQIRALGGRHLALPRLFIEHHGGSSFGSAEKLERIMRNNAIVAKRWPGYDREVQSFIATDPLGTARLALGLAWAGSLGSAVPVYLAHSMGGGAENWLMAQIAEDLKEIGAAVVLRVGGPVRWQIELHASSGVTLGATEDANIISRLLEAVPVRKIIYSCGVGAPDPVMLPEFLLGLAMPEDKVFILFHDFYPLSPSYTLLDADWVFRGPLGPGRKPPAGTDPAHITRRPDGTEVSLAEWQAAWRRLAARADELQVFARDGATQVAAVWPDLADRIRIKPHEPRLSLPKLDPPAPDAPKVIGVLGNIGRQKGALVLQDLAHRIGQIGPGAPRLVLVGTIDPAFVLPASVTITGNYTASDISHLARAHGITHWLISSIWPETFSYTTHEALATGLPVMVFGLGAQAEVAAAAPNGIVLPYAPEDELAAKVLHALSQGTLKAA